MHSDYIYETNNGEPAPIAGGDQLQRVVGVTNFYDAVGFCPRSQEDFAY